MRTKLLIAAAGLIGLAALPGVANAQPWGGGFGFRPEGPPFPHHRHEFGGPFPFLPPPPLYRPRVYYVPPPYEPPPPPVYYYGRPVYHSARVYVTPRVTYRSHVVHRAVRRTVQPAAAAPCTCALPSAAQPTLVPSTLPALRPAPLPAPGPATNVYPPERTQNP